MKIVMFALLALTQMAVAAPMQKLSFEDLKQACKDPKKFQNQIEPTSIRLECSDKVYKYIPAGTSTSTLPARRVVYFNVSSDKYTVPNAQEEVRTDSYTSECPLMKQIEETIAVSQEVTCEQIKDYTGTATQLCLSLLDGLRNDNPEAIQVRETGKVASFCKPDADKGASCPSKPSKPSKPGKKPLK